MFEATFECIQTLGVIGQNAEGVKSEGHKVTLGYTSTAGPNGNVQLGNLPPGVAHDFKLGQSYRVTIEPVC